MEYTHHAVLAHTLNLVESQRNPALTHSGEIMGSFWNSDFSWPDLDLQDVTAMQKARKKRQPQQQAEPITSFVVRSPKEGLESRLIDG